MDRFTLRRKRFGPEVASCVFVFAWDGQKRRVRARIGKPYRASAREWACPVEIRGFERRYPDFRGTDSMQALCHSTWLLRARFEAFLEDGGRVLDIDDGSEWSVDGVMATFGPNQPGSIGAKPLQAEDPRFLTIDLDIRSHHSLATLVAVSPWSHQPRTAKDQPDPHWAILNPPGGMARTAESAARKLLAHIRGLRGEARRCWKRAHQRVFDIGVQAGDSGRAFEKVRLTPATLRGIADIGADVKVTVYPAHLRSLPRPADANSSGSSRGRRKKPRG